MRLRVGRASDIGRARQRNEDSYLTAPPLYVVADGMGGHRGGKRASSLVVDSIATYLLNMMNWFYRLRCEGEEHFIEDLKVGLEYEIKELDRRIKEARTALP